MSYPSPTFANVNLGSGGGSYMINGVVALRLSGSTIQVPGNLDITGAYLVNGVPLNVAAGNGDMLKSVYDPNNDGKVSAAAAADSVPWTGVTSKPTFAAVAVSGDYNDLLNKPAGGGGGTGTGDMTKAIYDPNNDGKVNSAATADSVPWTGVTGKPTFAPVATTGAYADLTGKPTLATVATTGAYADLSGRPPLSQVALTGFYSSLLGLPTISEVGKTGNYNDLINKPTGGNTAGLPVLNVKNDFGAKGDNATNDTGAIQNAIYAATQGGVVFFPRGTYRVSGLLVPASAHDIVLLGESHASSILAGTSSGTSTLTMGESSGSLQHARVEHLGFIPAVNKFGSAEIRLVNTGATTLSDVVVYGDGGNKPYYGIQMVGGNASWQTHLYDVSVNNCNDSGIIVGDDSSGLVQDLWMVNVLVGGCFNGILFKNVSGVNAINVEALVNQTHGVVTYPGFGQVAKAIEFTHLICDTNGGHGLALYTNGGRVVDSQIVNSWLCSNAGNGLHVSGDVNGFQFGNTQFYNNGQNGALTQQCHGITFTGCVFKCNSTAGYNQSAGLYLFDGGNHISVTGCQMGFIGEPTGNWQNYGLGIGLPNNVLLVGNQTFGNVSGGKSQQSTPMVDVGNSWA